jgi:hypothetical protein
MALYRSQALPLKKPKLGGKKALPPKKYIFLHFLSSHVCDNHEKLKYIMCVIHRTRVLVLK